MTISRRHFIKNGTIGTAGLLTSFSALQGLAAGNPAAHNPLYTLSKQLAENWGAALLSMQVTNRQNKHYGTIIYPPENEVHGRMGDTIYPFLYLADTLHNSAYLDAAELLFQWMEKTVSQEDGSWLNEPVKGSWKGTTVFATIALAEAVKRHGHIMGTQFKNAVTNRLHKSGEFIYNNFNIEYGNINYPIASTYGLSLLGELLDMPRYTGKGRDIAHKALPFFSATDHLLTGEGTPYNMPSAKGCYSVDLGYNVEESLPSLVLYSLLTKDEEVLSAVSSSMEAHLAFMLPDGAWDNSWGTRNYKWTYWGSRTSDGCQPAYALLAAKNPAFYKAALQNTSLLQSLTQHGVLYGGPHYASHGLTASLHHTFCHLKALVTILDHGVPAAPANMAQVQLPREKAYGHRFYKDIQTTLVARGPYRATVTGYDRNYKDYKGGHASGGALSMLWHLEAGPIITASMNEYQLYEAGNMQADNDPLGMPLTPRIELQEAGNTYMNINDFSATITVTEEQGITVVETVAALVSKTQQHPGTGKITCNITYRFSVDGVTIHYKHDGDSSKKIKIIIPVISASTETVHSISDKAVAVKKQHCTVHLQADKPLHTLPMTGKRLFNFVPGMEAVPFATDDNDVTIILEVV
ncbi:hypothetical protein [Deminuibacter soli]|uniref:Twin-arginine translocation signal domain-containing protein n=1 Tax=Deminuibacter soli TaxID=2291815 RepID=A0A3E1NRJ7_9BACT|nr:hypothetical protein [Deminuibacter soli]RFM30527.1 hypothetical protein DXN05_06120 [Deminuibacter soli]